LASRICAAAVDGQILIDAAVAAELGEAFALARLGTRPLRGFAEAVPVFSAKPRDVDPAALPAAK
jgi:class 3 adenylate cyclase